MKEKKAKMGITAGVTTHFNISRKLRLVDKATIYVQDIKVRLKVDEWIKQAPADLYRAAHTGVLSLTRDVHHKLKQVIIIKHPELIEWSQRSKNKILFIKKIKKQLKSSKKNTTAFFPCSKEDVLKKI